ncbi:MAG: hypothetical protein KC609_04685 [Myxococcales bacterium]|nr:hypothetical protein [Myxococcales bacterium]
MAANSLPTLLRRIRDEKLSRNKHFDLFEDGELRRAHRLWGFIERAGMMLRQEPWRVISVRRVDDAEGERCVEVRIDVAELRFSWSLFLSETEFSMIREVAGEAIFELPDADDADMLPAAEGAREA